MNSTGLSAFPLTPITDDGIDEAGYARIVERIARTDVDSIAALGSTGGYAYLSRAERSRVADLTVQHAGVRPVIIGVSALRTRDVLGHVEDAQRAGASAVLLAPMTYQPLTQDEAFGLFEAVDAELSVPLVVYDNPITTGFTFTGELHGRIAELQKVASIKIPAVPTDPVAARARLAEYRTHVPERVTLGVSGDGTAVAGLLAGCETWYSVIAGVLPEECVALTRAALAGDDETALAMSDRFAPLWELFARYGSYRVAAAVAEQLGVLAPGMLPHPVRGIDADGLSEVARALAHAGIDRSS
ncbi:dihydrodipicolinate synthase family protein [Leucobacter sp. BZR 635]